MLFISSFTEVAELEANLPSKYALKLAQTEMLEFHQDATLKRKCFIFLDCHRLPCSEDQMILVITLSFHHFKATCVDLHK